MSVEVFPGAHQVHGGSHAEPRVVRSPSKARGPCASERRSRRGDDPGLAACEARICASALRDSGEGARSRSALSGLESKVGRGKISSSS